MNTVLLLFLVCLLAYIGIRILLAMLETSIWLCAFVLVLGALVGVAFAKDAILGAIAGKSAPGMIPPVVPGGAPGVAPGPGTSLFGPAAILGALGYLGYQDGKEKDAAIIADEKKFDAEMLNNNPGSSKEELLKGRLGEIQEQQRKLDPTNSEYYRDLAKLNIREDEIKKNLAVAQAENGSRMYQSDSLPRIDIDAVNQLNDSGCDCADDAIDQNNMNQFPGHVMLTDKEIFED